MRLLAVVMLLSCLLLTDRNCLAEQRKEPGQITIYASFPEEDKVLKGRPVMITIIADKKVVKQSEVEAGSVKIFSDVPVGAYEVRAEGEGMETIVKRGIAVTEKGDTELRFPMKAGKGVRVIAYGGDELSVARLSALVDRLEALIKELKNRK